MRTGRTPPIEPGTLISGRYQVQTRLAAGATSEVFIANDEKLGRRVALKVLRGETGDRRRFDAEMRLLASLDHPNLVRVFDAVDADGLAVLVMELVDGPSLAERLALGPLGDEQVRRVGAELAATLAYLHQRGVVHRDVKPANILLGRDGRARLADFGIARLADATHLTDVGQTIGTFVYMAPEQLADSQVGPPTDIYALGLVLVEALTGRRAFAGTGGEPVLARLARDPDIPAFLPNRWRSLLAAMTARRPEERPTAVDVGRHLAARGRDPTGVFVGGPVVTPTETLPPVAAGVGRAPVGPVPTVPFATRGGPRGWAPTVPIPSGWEPGGPVPMPASRRRPRLPRQALAVGAAIVVVLVLAVTLIASRSGSRRPALPPPASTIPATTAPPPVTTPSTAPPATPAPTTPAPTTTAPSAACSALQERLQALEAQRQTIEQNSALSAGARNALLRALDTEQRALEQAAQVCGR